MPLTACRNSIWFDFCDCLKMAIFGSRMGIPRKNRFYRNRYRYLNLSFTFWVSRNSLLFFLDKRKLINSLYACTYHFTKKTRNEFYHIEYITVKTEPDLLRVTEASEVPISSHVWVHSMTFKQL